MAIDIRNINEITFTQSFRGYNTEEVDDFLDSLYEEAVAANKTIEELKKRISELETTAGSVESSTENTYAVIANAQEEADRIIDNARLKAHALIESAENRQNEAPVPTQTSVGISFDAAKKLKELFNEMHEKQMAILENVSDNTEESLPKEEIENDIPMVSFAGITNEFTKKIPAERDILGEINAIDFGKLKPQSSPYDTGSPYQEESNETGRTSTRRCRRYK